jgi:arylsulfatase A-like enzyme
MMGNRAMYHDGWIACCRHGRLPWETAGTFSYDDDKWELYNTGVVNAGGRQIRRTIAGDAANVQLPEDDYDLSVS